MNNEKLLVRIKNCKNDIEKIELIKKFADLMDSLTLGKSIAFLSDINYIKKLTYQYQFKLCSKGKLEAITNVLNDEDRVSLINEFIRDLDNNYLSIAIQSINNIEYVNKFIKDYRLKLGTKKILEIIVKRKNDEDKANLINNLYLILESWALGVAIGHIFDLKLTIELIDKYRQHLGSRGILNVIGYRKNDNEKKLLIHKYFNNLNKTQLGIAIGSINNLKTTYELINQYQSILQSEGILNTINYKKNDNEKIELIKKYSEKLDSKSLGISIGSINDISKTNKLIKKYQPKLEQKGVFQAINFKKKNEKKINLINEYANFLKINYFDRRINTNNVDKKFKKIEKKIEKRNNQNNIFTKIKDTTHNIFTNLKNNINKAKEVLTHNSLIDKIKSKLKKKPQPVFNINNFIQNIKPKKKYVLNKKVVSLSLSLTMCLSATAMAANSNSSIKNNNTEETVKSSISLNEMTPKFDDNIFVKIKTNKEINEVVKENNLNKSNINQQTKDNDTLVKENNPNKSKTNQQIINNETIKENVIISIDDKITVDADYIYTDVFSAKDQVNGVKPLYENNKQRKVLGALIKIDDKYIYCDQKNDFELLINKGGIVASYVVGDEYGYEGAYNSNDVKLANPKVLVKR